MAANLITPDSGVMLMLATSETYQDIAEPKLTFIRFYSKPEAEAARTSIEAAKVPGLKVVPLYSVEG